MIFVQDSDNYGRTRIISQEELDSAHVAAVHMMKPFTRKTFLQKVASLSKALVNGIPVSAEQIDARLAICKSCEFVATNRDGSTKCKICGCQMGPKDKSFPNLAAYEETDSFGCYYYAKKQNRNVRLPSRSKWKEHGV